MESKDTPEEPQDSSEEAESPADDEEEEKASSSPNSDKQQPEPSSESEDQEESSETPEEPSKPPEEEAQEEEPAPPAEEEVPDEEKEEAPTPTESDEKGDEEQPAQPTEEEAPGEEQQPQEQEPSVEQPSKEEVTAEAEGAPDEETSTDESAPEEQPAEPEVPPPPDEKAPPPKPEVGDEEEPYFEKGIFAIKTSIGHEKMVADTLEGRIKRRNADVYSIMLPPNLRGYLLIEALDNREALRDLIKGVQHARTLVEGTTTIEEIEGFLTPKPIVSGIEEGDIVEVIAGPFKGEKAKVKQIDLPKEEITIELFEAMVSIPVTIRGDHVRVLEKESS
ncbi:MAG: transcription elongation factor Spt5 [Thermoplasmata archaeon]|nr:transcription elongation factor Spt5 [Thermoplasmata archaeon]